MPRKPAAWQRDFVERVGVQADLAGMPPSMVKVFAWLIVCEPQDQSVVELRDALTLSAGAVSAATVTLTRMGLVERLRLPGERRFHYRIRPGGWETLIRYRYDATAQIRATADDALAKARTAQPRLKEMRDFYAWFEDSLRVLVDSPR